MKLSLRLITIKNFVKENSIVADIGTDHGYIPGYLIENNISKKVIATDISKGSLDKAIEYIEKIGYKEYIDTRLGNGLEVLKPYEVDTIIIAGMGGLLIKDIIEKDLEITKTINNFIFQPMGAAEELRKYLYENNFKIIDEKIIKEDGKYYEIIYVSRGKDYIEDEIYYEISKKLLDKKDPVLREFIEFKINKTEEILKELEKTHTEKTAKRKEDLSSRLKKYKEAKNSYEGY
ncbi:tRNA (adenine(22)-N(1))-methyltransferase [Anaerosalibacter massiliensis]|uniref:Class I SAM-dependent methyltransferase n=1 Tax=Anaerosalibacter massiliensis TaxID=1347392 RepID=A0A9X2MJZ7_9FIRM|nr:class I SAM-dependent methyltransferase [Anaerosalibacter massiliensis]MCR2044933.1 class I SAM-dependent methyltransferase [Anaerosalibacter massiliensis]